MFITELAGLWPSPFRSSRNISDRLLDVLLPFIWKTQHDGLEGQIQDIHVMKPMVSE
jgi:hypothetical protein|tara:strand:+ start:3055 stop:3225 length:171 start_codon:yes stop_codon:yes gene_type:complete